MFHPFISCILFLAFMAAPAPLRAGAEPSAPPPQVFVLPVKGPIDKGMLMVLRRAFREAASLKPSAVLLELNTPGGGLEETKEIIAWIRSTRQNGCPVYAWVHPDALSAGAIISLACERIYMSGSATVGSAMPIAVSPLTGNVQQLDDDVHEKLLSAVRAMVIGLAQESGYRREIAEAMVDRNHPDISYTDGGSRRFDCPSGKLLNLTARDAAMFPDGESSPLLSSGTAETAEAVLRLAGLPRVRLVCFTERPADFIARWITTIAPLLFAIAGLLIYSELSTPGFGLRGLFGLALLALYFWGHYIAGMAGLEEAALIMAGLVLLALEIFVIPGFGITGIAGIACLLAGLLMAFIPAIPAAAPHDGIPSPTFLSMLPGAAGKLLLNVILLCSGLLLLLHYLPKVPVISSVFLSRSLVQGNGFTPEASAARAALTGQTGEALTDLRPAGKALVAGRLLDVVSTGGYIRKGATVRVVGEDGTGITVEEAKANAVG